MSVKLFHSHNQIISTAPPVADADALAFIEAAGITDLTQMEAIDQLVIDLKIAGVWANLYAIYPFVGGTALAHSVNLKQPGVFDLVFGGTWAHTATGGKPSSGGYAATGVIPDYHLPGSDRSLTYYGRTEDVYGCEFGVYAGGKYLRMSIKNNPTTFISDIDSGRSILYTPATGFFVSSRINNSDFKTYHNAVMLDNHVFTAVSDTFTRELYLNAVNAFGVDEPTTRECAFASIGEGLTPAEVDDMYIAVQRFQIALNREINDPDVEAFIAAAGITDLNQQIIIGKLVTRAKAHGWWALCDIIYPFIGSNAAAHKVNLKSPGTFDATFFGTNAHTATGFKGVTNGYADTGYSLLANVGAFSEHVSYYSRTAIGSTGSDTGAWNDAVAPYHGTFDMYLRYTDDVLYANMDDFVESISNPNTDGSGYYLLTRVASDNLSLYKFGNLFKNNTVVVGNNRPPQNIFINAVNLAGTGADFYGERECAFFTAGEGISAAIQNQMYLDIQAYQEALGREITPPPPPATDADAVAFIQAAGIASIAEANAIDQLVIAAKAHGWWALCDGIIPAVGGTAVAHAVNLKSPGTFDLTFVGSFIHNRFGFTPSVGTAYANTGYIPSVQQTAYNGHISFYSGTPNNTVWGDMGAAPMDMYINTGNTAYGYWDSDGSGQYATFVNIGAGDGFYLLTKRASNDLSYFKNDIKRATYTGVHAHNPSSSQITVGMVNVDGTGSARNCRFATWGEAMSDAIEALMFEDIQVFQEALAREVNPLDADASAFIVTAGITDNTQKIAINKLVINAKTNGWWGLCDVIYPFVGGTEASHNINLKEAATHALVLGSVHYTHTPLGIVPDGSGADVVIVPYTPSTDAVAFDQHMSLYSQTNIAGTGADMGAAPQAIFIRYTDNNFYSTFDQSSTYAYGPMTDSRGWFLATKTASNVSRGFKNGVVIGTDTAATTALLSTTPIWLNGVSGAGGTLTGKTLSFATVGLGMSDAMAALMYADIQEFQEALGRAVSPYDADAQEFITRAGITNTIQKNAINELILDLKSAGIYTKMLFIYPFVGGTASSHNKDIKNPGYDLEFFGSWVHSATGSKPSAPLSDTNYIKTWYTPATHTPTGSRHVSIYCRDDGIGGADWGVKNATTYLRLRTRINATQGDCQDNGAVSLYPSDTSSGIWVMSRLSGSEASVYFNTILKADDTNLYTNQSFTERMHINGVAITGGNEMSSPRECAFASAGVGLTEIDVIQLYNAVQTFQTALGRQV